MAENDTYALGIALKVAVWFRWITVGLALLAAVTTITYMNFYNPFETQQQLMEWAAEGVGWLALLLFIYMVLDIAIERTEVKESG